MALHFEQREFQGRIARACEALDKLNLDGLLMFAQESMYYLCGYETFGFCFFQCLYLGADGRLALLTRAPDLRQARHTSTLDDIRVWTDEAGATPQTQLKDMLRDLGAKGARLGIEYDSPGLNAHYGKAVDEALEGFCTLVAASDLIDNLRVIKSDAELVYVRRAAELADAALEAGLAETRAGAGEGDILAAMHSAIFRGGGEYPGNDFIIGSGRDALLCRHKSGRRRLSANDQLTLEFAGTCRRYHAALMRTIIIGEPRPRHLAMYDACRSALAACEENLIPGSTAGDVFDAHARAMDDAGFRDHRLNACGYSLGASFAPCWMDRPMFYHGNPFTFAPGMVFFAHMILMDSHSATAMTLGRTYLLGDGPPVSLSAASLDLVCR